MFWRKKKSIYCPLTAELQEAIPNESKIDWLGAPAQFVKNLPSVYVGQAFSTNAQLPLTAIPLHHCAIGYVRPRKQNSWLRYFYFPTCKDFGHRVITGSIKATDPLMILSTADGIECPQAKAYWDGRVRYHCALVAKFLKRFAPVVPETIAIIGDRARAMKVPAHTFISVTASPTNKADVRVHADWMTNNGTICGAYNPVTLAPGQTSEPIYVWQGVGVSGRDGESVTYRSV